MNRHAVSFHLIYRPGDATVGTRDQVVDFLSTDNPEDVAHLVGTIPDVIAIELEADTIQDACEELTMLGFTQFKPNGRRGLS